MSDETVAAPSGRGRYVSPSVKYNRNAKSLLSQRERVMQEMQARPEYARSPLIRKANTLLTSFWANSDWQSRAELLRTARWLLSLGAIQSPTVARAVAQDDGSVSPRPRVSARYRK